MAPRQSTMEASGRSTDSESILPQTDYKGIQEASEKRELLESSPTTNWLSSSFIMANIVLGVGLLNYPSAYKEAGGIVPALAFQTFCLLFIILGEVLIGICADISCSDTYQDTVHKHCGKFALATCSVFITVQNFGSCVMLMVVLADQVDGIIAYSTGPLFCQKWYYHRSFTLSMLSMLLILPTCFWRRIDGCVVGSYIGVGTTLYIIFLTIWKYIHADVNTTVKFSRPGDWSTIVGVIPTVCFSLEGHIEVVAIYACYRRRNLCDFIKAVLVSNAICILVYTITGIFGYLTFGDDISTDLLLSYNADWLLVVAFAITGVKAVTTYPVLLFCVRQVLEEEMNRMKCLSRTTWSDDVRDKVTSLLLFFLSLLLALIVPNIGSIISLLGGTSALFIFIYPGLCYMQAYKDSRETWATCRVALGVVITVVGATFMFTATILSGFHFYRGMSQPDHHFCV